MWYPANIYHVKEDFAMYFAFRKQALAECDGFPSGI